MPEYQLEIKQLVSYPRCRIYREFLQTLIADRSVRTNGRPGLFCYTVLCSYANFRTSYLRMDGISYTIYPGEWICRVGELTAALRLRSRRRTLEVLETFQERHLIQYSLLGRGNLVKYKIVGWHRHNTVLEYNCPCQKETGFFFLPVVTATELISVEKCSEMDILLDLWISAVYRDEQVQGSFDGPVAYLRNGTGCPLVSYAELAQRWGCPRPRLAGYCGSWRKPDTFLCSPSPAGMELPFIFKTISPLCLRFPTSWWTRMRWPCPCTSGFLPQTAKWRSQ